MGGKRERCFAPCASPDWQTQGLGSAPSYSPRKAPFQASAPASIPPHPCSALAVGRRGRGRGGWSPARVGPTRRTEPGWRRVLHSLGNQPSPLPTCRSPSPTLRLALQAHSRGRGGGRKGPAERRGQEGPSGCPLPRGPLSIHGDSQVREIRSFPRGRIAACSAPPSLINFLFRPVRDRELRKESVPPGPRSLCGPQHVGWGVRVQGLAASTPERLPWKLAISPSVATPTTCSNLICSPPSTREKARCLAGQRRGFFLSVDLDLEKSARAWVLCLGSH